mmetsp:Transcript_26968/g.29403  ORF Transcript_26968/g.29403 Transcript_26968/m.29403 type:complete len:394 (+) Transcript_26968:91-1272(+)
MLIFCVFVVFGILTLFTDAQYTTTVLAGTGTQGYSGDNEPAVSAKVNIATGAWVDTNGVTFFVDYSAYVVRQVNKAGIISTIGGTGGLSIATSGGDFTDIDLYNPWGLAGDSTHLYVSDSYHIWKYTRSNGLGSILAGTGTLGVSGNGGPAASSDVNRPEGLWLTTGNVLYIAEYGSNLVRKITLSNNIISTVAGIGTAGLGGDGESPLSTNTKLSSPSGVYVDTNGVIYIADRSNSRVRYISNGIINTFAGGGTNSASGYLATNSILSNPFDVIGDTLGNIYIVESSSIRVVDYQTNILTSYLSGITGPKGIWLDNVNTRTVIPMLAYVKTAPLYSNAVSTVTPTQALPLLLPLLLSFLLNVQLPPHLYHRPGPHPPFPQISQPLHLLLFLI